MRLALLAALLLLPGCTLCWPRGGGIGECVAVDDDDAGDDDTGDDDSGDDDDSTGPDDLGMLPVPAGVVRMGCDPQVQQRCENDAQPVRPVDVSAFRMHEFEVTRAEFVDFLNANGNVCDGGNCIGVFSGPEVDEDADGSWYVLEGFERTPVMEVTWAGADAYCRWIGGRLPTEAEWERAARGDDERSWPWGEEDIDCSRAVYGDGCGTGGPWDVGSPREAGRSPFGMVDMTGNAWEWVSDWYDPDYYATAPEADPPGPVVGTSRVVRGGGWESNLGALEPWNRWGRTPEFGNSSVGFRCATSP